MKKILLVDCDGTIRKPKSKNKFIQNPEDQEPIPGAAEAMEGFDRIIGITNQAGVHYKHKTLTECIDEQFVTLKLFPQLQSIYFCPDLGESCYKAFRLAENKFGHQKYIRGFAAIKHNFRKPAPGMLLIAIEENGYRPEEALYIGDRPEDEEAAINARIDFKWAKDWRN